MSRELEAAGRDLALAATGGVATERENVLAAQRADLFQQLSHLLPRVVDARQVRHRRQALPLDAVHDHQRLLARAAAGAVGDRAKVRRGLAQRRDVFLQQSAVAFAGLGRKEFERDDRPPGRHFRRIDVTDELHRPRNMPP